MNIKLLFKILSCFLIFSLLSCAFLGIEDDEDAVTRTPEEGPPASTTEEGPSTNHYSACVGDCDTY